MPRKLIIQKELPGGPAEFPVAVCQCKGEEKVILAWFRTEADARLFAGAEGEIERWKREVDIVRSQSRSSYYRGMMAVPPSRGSI